MRRKRKSCRFEWLAGRARGVAAMVFALLFCAGSLAANVVRPAPEFDWIGTGGVIQKSSKFRGQPVVLLIAPSPRDWKFRGQVGQLKQVYQRLSATGAVCVAAFTRDTGVIRSNIPFVLTPDGPRIAYLFGVERGFSVAMIGRDGNLDCISPRVLSGQRVLDLIGNSFVVQQNLRRD